MARKYASEHKEMWCKSKEIKCPEQWALTRPNLFSIRLYNGKFRGKEKIE